MLINKKQNHCGKHSWDRQKSEKFITLPQVRKTFNSLDQSCPPPAFQKVIWREKMLNLQIKQILQMRRYTICCTGKGKIADFQY